MRPGSIFLFSLITFMVLFNVVNADTLLDCSSSTYLGTGLAKGVAFAPSNNVTITEIMLCFTGTLNSSRDGLTVCSFNGTSGSPCLATIGNSVNCSDGSACGGSQGKKFKCSFNNLNLSATNSTYYYLIKANNTNMGIITYSSYTRCFSPYVTDTPAVNTFLSHNEHLRGYINGYNYSLIPTVRVIAPSNGSTQPVNFTFSVYVSNITSCASANIEREFLVYDTGETLYSNNSVISADGYYNFTINNNSLYGGLFTASSSLYCNGVYRDGDFTHFYISLENTTNLIANNSLLTNPYNKVCFLIPLASYGCGSNLQNIYIYYNDVLAWSVINTTETEICIRDRNLDGYTKITIKRYCSDNLSLIETQDYYYTFQYQAKYLGAGLSSFIEGIKTPLFVIILMMLIGSFIWSFFRSMR